MGVGLFVRDSKIHSQASPQFFICNTDITTIGRHGSVKLDTIQGKEISKIHCKLFRKRAEKDEYWILEDNRSLNGTFVNGRKIHRVIIKHGDEIVFGGGKQFSIGEKVLSTEDAECRYFFYIPPPCVHFETSVDPNQVYEENTDEDDMCPICYAPIIGRETLPCGHSFCINCIHQWARVSAKAFRPCVCPLCRAIFHQSELSPEEGIVTSESIDIYCVQPFLHALNVNSCRAVKGANIFKPWNETHKQWFFAAFNAVKNSYLRRCLFLSITKANIYSILGASLKELKIAMANFGLEAHSKTRDGYLVPILYYVSKNFLPTPQSKSPYQKPTFYPHYYN